MVGRLARYLRMTGCDTLYAQGWSDNEIVRRAASDHRIVVTRDRELAGRIAGAVLLRSGELAEQMRAVRLALPGIPDDVTFERCTLCNGLLTQDGPPEARTDEPSSKVPPDRPRYRCEECGHLYWEGSHTAEVRRRLKAWQARSSG
jgi:uncharacterized protein